MFAVQAYMNVHHIFQQIDVLINALIYSIQEVHNFQPSTQATNQPVINVSTQRPNKPNLPPQNQHDNRKITII